MLERPVSLITITHTGAYSTVAAARAAGWSVCAPQGMRVEQKLEIIEREGREADLVWAHWGWVERAPWLLSRRVVTILRDPIECAISAHLRGFERKAVGHARQWMDLWRNRHQVDDWVDFRALDLSCIGLRRLPKVNATPPARIKDMYRDRKYRPVRREMRRHWDCLQVINREIAEVFEAAGFAHRLKGTGMDTV